MFTGSPFGDKDHNYIIAGILKIITNNKLQKRFPKSSKGPANRATDYGKTK